MDSMCPARVLGALKAISTVLTDIICRLKPSTGQQFERQVENRLPKPVSAPRASQISGNNNTQ